MDRKIANAAVENPDMPFIYVDLQNPEDWAKIEWILSLAHLPGPTPSEQTSAAADRGRQ